MASNYWTEGRKLMVRLQAGYIRCNDIAKEFLEVQICDHLGSPRADFDATWRRWCHANIAHIRRYRFWNNQAKEEDEGEEIPVFTEIDVTFISYLLRAIDPDHRGFRNMQAFRNHIAHSPLTEFPDVLAFEEQFRKIQNVVDELFETQEEVRQKWQRVLLQIRTDAIGPEELEKITNDFEERVKEDKEKDDQISVNINVQNSGVHGGIQNFGIMHITYNAAGNQTDGKSPALTII